ncbi:oligosaccharide flippase family protein [Exiguobacterium sp. BRG2]|uniref:oligosaccharide flippase family protein n=1 Tax=Exiguobacterium sp. BRG2 TaxID=2962584 RepID=UPI0028822846|nr:oligosaccharide flippase family protein [Exiguobacterium sp. BRG2]MDT0172778.1 oligosaccharide flippase family protein [Exiguobacterium sp. BRG2]
MLTWSFMGNIIYTMSQFVILMLLSYGGDYDDVGKYGFALAVTAPIIKITNMQLNLIISSDQKHELNFSSLFKIRIVFLVGSLLFLIISLFLLNFNRETYLIIVLIFFSKIIESLNDLIYGYFQRDHNINLVGKSKILKGIFSSITFAISYIISNSVIIALFVLNITWLTILAIDLNKTVLYKSDIKKNIDKYKKIIIISFPLGIAGTFDLINVNIPRYLSQYFLTNTELGFYTIISYLMIAGGVLIDSICITFLPRLSRYIESKEFDNFYKMIKKINIFASILSILGIIISYFFGSFVLSILFNISNLKVEKLLVIIMFGCSFWYFSSFYNTYLYAMKIYKNQLKIMIVCFAVTVLSGFYLVENAGLLGAGWVFVIYMFTRFSLTFAQFYLNKINVYKIMGEYYE